MNNDDEIIGANTANWIVTSVDARKNYILILTFKDGKRKVYNALPLLEKPIFEPLKNLDFFLTAKADGTSVSWNDDIDIAPEHLYDYSEEI